MAISSPPQPPLLPPRSTESSQAGVKLSSKISPFIQKLQQAPNGYWFEPEGRPEPVDVLAPRQGLYFCYGTLTDPSLFSEILDLPSKPKVRPVKLVGYSLKL
jgi:hypothetical protein